MFCCVLPRFRSNLLGNLLYIRQKTTTIELTKAIKGTKTRSLKNACFPWFRLGFVSSFVRSSRGGHTGKPRALPVRPPRENRGRCAYDFRRYCKFQKLDVDGIIKLRQDLREINANIPFAKMLPEESTIPTVKTPVGTVAQGSTIHKQLQDYIPPPNLITPVFSSSPAGKENANPVSSSTLLTIETSLDINGQELGLNNATTTPLSTVHPLVLPLLAMLSHIRQTLILITNSKSRIIQVLFQAPVIPLKYMNCQQQKKIYLFFETLTDKQKKIEMATRGQLSNPTWFEQKQNRISASICKGMSFHICINRGQKSQKIL